MAAHDDARTFGPRETNDIGAEPRPVDADVEQQHLEKALGAITHVDRPCVGHSVGVRVDVAADGGERRDLCEAIEHLEVADIARVQHVIRMLGRNDIRALRMGLPVGIGDDDDP